MDNKFENYNEVVHMAASSLRDNGVFMLENFIDDDICDSVSKKVMNFLDNDVDKTTTKEYENYIVHARDTNKGGHDLDEQLKPIVNIRGKNGWDTNFYDIFNADLLFEEAEELITTNFFKDILGKFEFVDNKGRDCLLPTAYFNIYYTDGITDTRGWHKDAPMIKFFIYLTDVLTEDDGPYCYVPKSYTENRHTKVENSEHDVNNHIKFLAKKGTLIGSFQHGIHRGWPQAEGHKRVMSVSKVYLDRVIKSLEEIL